MYLGNIPSTSFEAVKKDRFTGLTGTGVTLSHSVSSVQDIVVWVNNVKQDYNNYTVSNTALTLGGSLVSADVVQVLYVGRTFQTVNPPNASVGSAQIADDLISGKTALGATPADTDELLISDAGTLKRVDYSYLKSANTPVFSARKTGSAQSLSDGSYVKITFNTVDIDTDSAYSSDRFTVPSGQAGKYLFNASIMFENDTHSATQYAITAFYKNGSQVTENQLDFRNNYGGYGNNLAHSFIIDLAASDYIEVYGAMGKQSGTITANYHATKVRTFFQGCKLIGA